MVIRAHDDTSAFAFRDHRAGIGQGERERLFAHHVLFGRRGCKYLITMQFVGGRDINGINIGGFHQRGEICRRAGNSMGFGVASST